MNLQRLRTVLGWMKGKGNKLTAIGPWSVVIALFLCLNIVLLFDFMPKQLNIAVGQVARRDVVAPRRVMNKYRTEQLRQQATDSAQREAAAAITNYKIDPSAAYKAEEKLAGIFNILRIELHKGPANAQQNTKAVNAKIKEEYGLDISADVVKAAFELTPSRLDSLEAVARKYSVDTMRSERISENQVDIVCSRLEDKIIDAYRSTNEQKVLAGVVNAVVAPNLTLDRDKVDKLVEQAKRLVQPVYVEQGQIIVREKDLIQTEHYEVMKDLGLLDRRANYLAVLGVVIMVAMLLTAMAVYVFQFNHSLVVQQRSLVLLGSTLLVVACFAKAASLFAWEGTGYLIPTALAGMLLAILLDSRLAIMAVLFLAVIVALVMGQDAKYVIMALSGGLAGVFSVSRVSQRMDLTRAGLVVGFVNFIALIALGLFRAEPFLLKFSVLGVFNGLVSAILAIGLLPYLETLFGITSPIRLLELSNSNQPLLRRLLIEVPGSYHHSLIVGNLAEAAAEAVGGNALLARVGAQYHDIGKLRRPDFFIENQYGGENPHDNMTPAYSAMIITSHVSDGVELAQQGKLPQEIIDIIEQHHGNDIVRYFHHKAQECAQGEPVEEKDYRYPGPRPQTKEAAIVMLADCVEAAVRSLQRPTPESIEELVRHMIRERLNDGQFDESDLTLKDLDRMAKTFVKVLTGIFHRRIEYPKTVLAEAEADAGEVS